MMALRLGSVGNAGEGYDGEGGGRFKEKLIGHLIFGTRKRSVEPNKGQARLPESFQLSGSSSNERNAPGKTTHCYFHSHILRQRFQAIPSATPIITLPNYQIITFLPLRSVIFLKNTFETPSNSPHIPTFATP